LRTADVVSPAPSIATWTTAGLVVVVVPADNDDNLQDSTLPSKPFPATLPFAGAAVLRQDRSTRRRTVHALAFPNLRRLRRTFWHEGRGEFPRKTACRFETQRPGASLIFRPRGVGKFESAIRISLPTTQKG